MRTSAGISSTLAKVRGGPAPSVTVISSEPFLNDRLKEIVWRVRELVVNVPVAWASRSRSRLGKGRGGQAPSLTVISPERFLSERLKEIVGRVRELVVNVPVASASLSRSTISRGGGWGTSARCGAAPRAGVPQRPQKR